MTTKNAGEMTTQECRDWLARKMGWGCPGDRAILLDGTTGTLTRYVRSRNGWPNEILDSCPMPATIDAAAVLPEGWSWQVNDLYWHAFPRSGPAGNATSVRVKRTDSEICDRFRLRVAVEMAERSKA